MRFSYPAPKTDDDFEYLCWQLLKRHWNRPQLQRYGHKGERQDGVDIHDPSQTKPIYAAQCKLKEAWKTLPPKEIQDEVNKAKHHKPPIDHFTILTTGKKSRLADNKIAAINQLHAEQGLFKVEVLTWDQIEAILDVQPDVRDPIYNTLSGQTVSHIDQKLSLILASLDSTTIAADSIDVELDGIKVEIERHELTVAHRLATRLEERHGDKLSSRQRWRLHTFRANICLHDGRFEEAGRLLLLAKEHQPQEEKALVNEALGYELTGDIEKAHELAAGLRGHFPHSGVAAAVWVRTAPETIPTQELEAAVAEFAAREVEVAIALSIRYGNQEDFAKAEQHARRASELAPKLPQVWLFLGNMLHAQASNELHAEKREAVLLHADAHYTQCITLAHAQKTGHLEAYAFLNRGILRGRLGRDNADDDFRAARSLAPLNIDAMLKNAVHLASTGQMDRAVDEARAAVKADPSSESKVHLAAMLWNRDQNDDKQQALSLFLQVVPHETSRFDAIELAILALTDFEKWDQADSLLRSLPPGRISDVAHLTYLSLIQLAQNNLAEAEKVARQAHNLVSEASMIPDIRRLANVLYRLNLLDLALVLFRRTWRPGCLDLDAQTLLRCATQLHRHDIILDVCRTMREAGVDDECLLHTEINVLQVYDRPAAIGVLQGHLSRHPDNRLVRLRLSLLGIQCERPELVISDINQLPTVDEADPAEIGAGVVHVLCSCGKTLEAAQYAYALLREHHDDPTAHMLFCNVLMENEHQALPIAAFSEVKSGAAVAYREKGDNHDSWLIVEDDYPAESQQAEYASSHPRVLPMLGKKVGDTFVLSQSGIQERSAVISDIVSKYVYRCRKSLQQFQVQFPEHQGIQQVRLAPDKPDDKTLDFSPVFSFLDNKRQSVDDVLAIYDKQPTPIGLLAFGTGCNIFQTMESLTSQPDRGLRWCCHGNMQERADALRTFKEARTIVLDITALYTIWKLNLEDLIGRWKSRTFCVSPATHDYLKYIVQASHRKAHAHIASVAPGRYIYTKADNDNSHAQSLQMFQRWVYDNCSLTYVQELANLEPTKREKLTQCVNPDEVQSMVLGMRPGHVLWTDDGVVALLAHQELGNSQRSWTQNVLQAALEEGVLDQNGFDDYSARLIGLGYSFTSCSPSIVLRAGMMTSWQCGEWPFKQVIGQFGMASLEPVVRIVMATESIVRMFKSESSPFRRQAFVLAVLNQFASRQMAITLATALNGAFGVDAFAASQAVGNVQDWLQGSLLP